MMPRRKRITRQAQRAASLSETQILQEKVTYFLGSAKVLLRDLDFSRSSARELNEANIERLVSAFELSGCQRSDGQFHIPAVIDPRVLNIALRDVGASTEDLRSHEPMRWPTLAFPARIKIECLHGQHRAVAAQRYLKSSDQWWVVDLYSLSVYPM